MVLSKAGAVFACGLNKYGQLGLGDSTSHSTPQLVPLQAGEQQIGRSSPEIQERQSERNVGINEEEQRQIGGDDAAQNGTKRSEGASLEVDKSEGVLQCKDVACGWWHTCFLT